MSDPRGYGMGAASTRNQLLGLSPDTVLSSAPGARLGAPGASSAASGAGQEAGVLEPQSRAGTGCQGVCSRRGRARPDVCGRPVILSLSVTH